jgi:hypothetical protein
LSPKNLLKLKKTEGLQILGPLILGQQKQAETSAKLFNTKAKYMFLPARIDFKNVWPASAKAIIM